ncbi:peptidoglycan-binding protein [Myxococcus sp. SDU36]|uniref:peptidoglycan-binding protein n=1 Tax=Myxococcus sp. SDU36 TaxID=2831967 RepID=UPI002542D50B|nr:peptidoglycan-binding protein [Myxococcus sp. SDU36]WIG94222.1 peptidoglycan-binding protein [Myxococcus sp. SDU36]
MSRIQSHSFFIPSSTPTAPQCTPATREEGVKEAPPAPPRNPVRDIFEHVVSLDALRRLQGLAMQVNVAPHCAVPPTQPRGGPPSLTDATDVASVAFNQSDRADDGPVTRLQQFLEGAGYLDMGGADYGTFGRLTQAALMAFQTAEGLSPADGTMSPATLAAMQRPQHPATDPTMSSLAQAYAPQLGRPMSPLEPGRDGAMVQQFEHGTLTRLPGGEVRVQDLNGEDLVPPVSPSTVSTLEEATAFHVAQCGAEGYRDFNDGSKYYGGNDCGPASVVIAATAVGAMAPPGAAGAGEAIDTVRENILDDPNSNTSVTMTVTQVAEGVTDAGAVATVVGSADVDMAAVDAALSRGHPVILGGNPFGNDPDHQAWGPTARADDNYLMGENFGGHWVTVTGMTESGNYIVNDPLCPNGPIEVTPEQMAEYVDGNLGMVEVSPMPVPVS